MASFRLLLAAISLLILQESLHSQEGINQQLALHIEEGIKFLESDQITHSEPGLKYAGEWPTYMMLTKRFPLLGGKKAYQDSNCFSVTAIHNALAQIYLKHPNYNRIPPMLDKAFLKMMDYKKGQVFNFWNLLPPTRDLQRKNEPDPQPLVRRPTTFKLKSRYIHNAANVAEDADDTSQAYSAMGLRLQILKHTKLDTSLHFNTDSLGVIVDQYRDLNRVSRYYFNYLTGNDHGTGAFLTWLGEEFPLKKWNAAIEIGYNAFFWHPSSKCYPQPYESYIPYGSNNIDAIVNSNILSALSINGLDAEGKQSAIKYLEKKSRKKKYHKVGSYYPNSYHFPYALSEAYANGVTELEESSHNIYANILRKQKKNGSWVSRRRLNKRDRLQSTAYALNALINFGDIESRETKKAIEKGIAFLITKAQKSEEGIHWKGGVFFSGGTVIRNNLIWTSDAYTTVIIIKAFANYLSYLEAQNVKHN